MSHAQYRRPPSNTQTGLLVVSALFLLSGFGTLFIAVLMYRSTTPRSSPPGAGPPVVSSAPAPAPRGASTTATTATSTTATNTATATTPATVSPRSPAPAVAMTDRIAPGARKLNLIDLFESQHVVRGDWKKQSDGRLVCSTRHLVPRIQLPYIPPDEYNVRLAYKQPALRHAVGIIFPCLQSNRMSVWEMPPGDSRTPTTCRLYFSGFQAVEVYKKMQPDVLYTVEVHFRRDRIRAYLDSQEILNYPTSYSRPTPSGFFRMPSPRQLGISCDDPTEFHLIELQEVSGPGQLLQ